MYNAGMRQKSDITMSNLLENWNTGLILLWPRMFQRILENTQDYTYVGE